jgi:hypothetical protein
MSNLIEFVKKHAVRGACKCGKCYDAPPNQTPATSNPHSVNLTLFEVSIAPDSDKPSPEEFLSMVKKEYPAWLDGNEHSYPEIGAAVGDQGLGLMIIGLGHLLGIWKCLSPDTLFPAFEQEIKMQLAISGSVTLIK